MEDFVALRDFRVMPGVVLRAPLDRGGSDWV